VPTHGDELLAAPTAGETAGETYRHEALLYAGPVDFVDQITPFVLEGLALDEPVLVAAQAVKLDLVRAALAADADRVAFLDMGEVGRNPARVIPAWRDFVAEHAPSGRRLRGVGEPIWPGRTSAELIECERHESLLNLAFPDDPPLWLVCPYDVTALGPAVIAEARANHPFVGRIGASCTSAGYRPPDPATPFDDPLPAAPPDLEQLAFDATSLSVLRRFVARRGADLGMARSRIGDLLLAADELATNSVRHGGGSGTVRLWREEPDVVCEVRDEGCIDDPLVGRARPSVDQVGGRGVWLVNRVSDLVQVRTFPTGNIVRIRMAAPSPGG
jgi:anti-sigma regulatory factor (Ser/Thr protein kinase)